MATSSAVAKLLLDIEALRHLRKKRRYFRELAASYLLIPAGYVMILRARLIFLALVILQE